MVHQHTVKENVLGFVGSSVANSKVMPFVNPGNAGAGTVVAPESAIGKVLPETNVHVAVAVGTGAKDHAVLLEIGAIEPAHYRKVTTVDANGSRVRPGINAGSAAAGIGVSQEINSIAIRAIGFRMALHELGLCAAR